MTDSAMYETSTLGTDDCAVSIEEEDAYSTQFFGFSPQSFINGIYNDYCQYLMDAMNALNESILTTFKDRVSEIEVKDTSKRQAQTAVKRLDAVFDKAEAHMKINIFTIPAGVMLPEDRAHLEDGGNKEDQCILESNIRLQEDKILAVKFANAKLEQRISHLDQLNTDVSQVLDGIREKHQTITPSGAFEEETKFRKATQDLTKVMEAISKMDEEINC